MKDFMKDYTFLGEEFLKRKANVPSKAINEVKTRKSGLPVAPSDPSCYLSQPGAFPEGSHRPFMQGSPKTPYAPTELRDASLTDTTQLFQPPVKQKLLFPPRPPVSVQSP